jgi:hypothetical protein
MSNLAVGMADYAANIDQSAGAEGFDMHDSGQAQELFKAMEAGALQGGDMGGSQTNAGALKYESLDANLKNITFKETDIRVWKMIDKTAAYNTVEEYNQLISYGNDRGGFNNEGELPEEEDSLYKRRAEHVKYLGVTKSVTHPLQLVKTQVGNMIQQEVSNGIKWILRKADRALLYGDEKLVGQEWNGLYAQHLNNDQYTTLEDYMNSELVVDLRGKTLKEGDIDKASEVLLRQFATPDTLISAPVVFTDFAQGFYARNRGTFGVANGTGGTQMTAFQAQFSRVVFEYDIFAAKATGKLPNSPAGHTKAPMTPTAGAAPAAVVAADGLTKFTDGAGDYFYAVSAVNRYGESAMLQLGATITVAATESVDLQFTATAGPYTPASYVIYRSDVDPTSTYANTRMSPIMTIAATGTDTKRGSLAAGVDGAAATKVRDRNRYITGTQEALLLQKGKEVLEFKQLAPMMKMDLAKLSPADRFMVLLYGTPIVFAPSKMVRFINIGRTA